MHEKMRGSFHLPRSSASQNIVKPRQVADETRWIAIRVWAGQDVRKYVLMLFRLLYEQPTRFTSCENYYVKTYGGTSMCFAARRALREYPSGQSRGSNVSGFGISNPSASRQHSTISRNDPNASAAFFNSAAFAPFTSRMIRFCFDALGTGDRIS